MKTVILLHKHYDTDHLEQVKAQMQSMGMPQIHAVWAECYDAWVALEGCHRLRAAAALGIPVDMIEVECDDTQLIDFDWAQNCDPHDQTTVDDIVNEAARRYNDDCYVTVEIYE